MLEAGHEIQAAIDHGATISLYLNDPDGNGIELYYDRPRDAWHDTQGRPVIQADPFPLEAHLEAPGPIEEDAEAATGPGA